MFYIFVRVLIRSKNTFKILIFSTDPNFKCQLYVITKLEILNLLIYLIIKCNGISLKLLTFFF